MDLTLAVVMYLVPSVVTLLIGVLLAVHRGHSSAVEDPSRRGAIVTSDV